MRFSVLSIAINALHCGSMICPAEAVLRLSRLFAGEPHFDCQWTAMITVDELIEHGCQTSLLVESMSTDCAQKTLATLMVASSVRWF